VSLLRDLARAECEIISSDSEVVDSRGGVCRVKRKKKRDRKAVFMISIRCRKVKIRKYIILWRIWSAASVIEKMGGCKNSETERR